MKDQSLKIGIENDELVIRIGVETLAFAANECPADGFLDDEAESIYEVTDKDEFAKSVVSALTEEKEDGTTLVHEMFDKAFSYIVEQGMLGIDEIL